MRDREIYPMLEKMGTEQRASARARFALDSPLEERGYELPVPPEEG